MESTVAEYNVEHKAAIKSIKSTEQHHYTERLITEKAKVKKMKKEIDTQAHLSNVSYSNPFISSMPGRNVC